MLSYALTTATRLSNYMGISVPTGVTLSAMERMIDAVTTFVENYTGRRFKKTVYTQEEYDTEEAETLNLKHLPVVAGQAFTLERRNSGLNEDDWETVDSQYYHVDRETGMIEFADGITLSRRRKGYRVTYTAGYDFDNATTFLSDTEAGDVELAVWMLMEGLWNKRKGGSGISHESIGDYSVTYRKELMENEDLQAILDKYATLDTIGVITPFQS